MPTVLLRVIILLEEKYIKKVMMQGTLKFFVSERTQLETAHV